MSDKQDEEVTILKMEEENNKLATELKLLQDENNLLKKKLSGKNI